MQVYCGVVVVVVGTYTSILYDIQNDEKVYWELRFEVNFIEMGLG